MDLGNVLENDAPFTPTVSVQRPAHGWIFFIFIIIGSVEFLVNLRKNKDIFSMCGQIYNKNY